MTIVGKILIFFVLVFCLVAGGMMIVVYSTSRNYADAYAKACDTIVAVREDRDQYRSEADQLRQEKADLEKKVKAAQEDAEKKVTAVRSDLEKERAVSAGLRQERDSQKNSITAAQGTSDLRGDQVGVLQKQIEGLNTTIRTQLEEIDKERDQRVHAEVSARPTRTATSSSKTR